MGNQSINTEQNAMIVAYFQSKKEEGSRLWREVQQQSLELERLNLKIGDAIQTLKALNDHFSRFTPSTLPAKDVSQSTISPNLPLPLIPIAQPATTSVSATNEVGIT